MPNPSLHQQGLEPDRPPTEAPVWSVVAAVAVVMAAWIAAGSTGVLADPLRRVLTWSALLVALAAGAPRPRPDWMKLGGLAAAVTVAVLMTASVQAEVHVLAVALVGAAVAWVHRDLPRRVVLLGALAALVLAVFRLAAGAVPALWLAADGLAAFLGRLAGTAVGEPLEVGATYGGLDFLVVMAAIYAGWLSATPAPRLQRGLLAAAVILLGHFAYLVLLAHTDTLVAMLPERVIPAESDRQILGVWTWGNAARRLLPWNVPLAAAAVHAAVLALMLRWSAWLPVAEPEPNISKWERRKGEEELAGTALLADMAWRFGPVVLAVLLPAIGWLAAADSDLGGKRVVAYEEGLFDWARPTHEDPEVPAGASAGMLPVLVESLGGTFVRSAELSAHDLDRADVVLLLHPDRPWPPERLERLWNYVRGGGSLLVAAEPRVALRGSVSSFDAVLEPTGIGVYENTTIGHQPNWEDGFQVPSHPATAGLGAAWGAFGFRYGSSLAARWPARPVLVGRYGYGYPGSDAALTGAYRYEGGHRLGDLVLAAEQRFGAGRVFVVGDASGFANGALPASYPFVGRLLGYLAGGGTTPQAGWRQALTFLAAVGLVALLGWRAEARRVGLAAVVLAAALASTAATSRQASRVLPDGRAHKPRHHIAYITATHAELFGRESLMSDGLAALNHTLMRNDYLPLLMPDFREDRLERAGLLITIAPARPYSRTEIVMVERFVRQGGHVIAMVGAEESRPSRPLLAALGFHVPPSPVHPGEDLWEPIPLGSFRHRYHQEGDFVARAQFWSAWPVLSEEPGAEVLTEWTIGEPVYNVTLSRPLGAGTATVIGDSYFALNRNFDAQVEPAENDHYWRWLLARLAGPKPWYPTPSEPSDPDGQIPAETATEVQP